VIIVNALENVSLLETHILVQEAKPTNMHKDEVSVSIRWPKPRPSASATGAKLPQRT
jgi:hypothetical protein